MSSPRTAQGAPGATNDTAAVRHCPTCRCGRPRRSQGGIRRTADDARFSKAIRARDHYTCQRCGAVHAENSSGLHAAHCFGRRTGSTRLDPDNAVALCYGCHRYMDEHGKEKLAFFRERLGDEAFEALQARAKGKRNR